MTRTSLFLSLLLLISALFSAACSPSIGDGCESNSECDSDQICDLSQVGGYCTITPCPRIGCPSGSVCVQFDERSSWCMQKCGLFAYCREGYTCVNGFPDPLNPGQALPAFCNQLEPVITLDAVQDTDIQPDAADAY
ncbi:MAG TPA: hypothetical protein PLY68_00140 [Myxococcota bacterium]|nr:hypothetical protein [Myxococcota bacterium]HNZ02674.1 hypothetical protein [Myxococcota bacterium]HOD06701.1 hypothetical protein [Myxococcota bacterium]HPB50037.1 hypothetical protein [Myxococcota bacterium]HQP94591.1 hypothetical protein [Myxococcota bacterium]